MGSQLKRLLVLLTVFAIAVVLAGCSGSGSGSAAGSGSASSSQASSQSKEDLIAELTQASGTDYKSLTMDGCMSMDYAGSKTSVPFIGKMDISGLNLRMYMAMAISGMPMEVFIDGDDATVIMSGVLTSGSATEMGLAQYTSTDSLMNSFGGSFIGYPDTIESISKSYDGDDAVYEVVINAEKLNELAGSQSSQLTGTPSGTLEAMDGTLRVGKDGRISDMNINMTVSGQTAATSMRLYDYDSTVLPATPGTAEETAANPDKNAAYAMTEYVNYGSGQSSGAMTNPLVIYRHDAEGNAVDSSMLSRIGNDIVLARVCYGVDEDGWIVSQTNYRVDTGEEQSSGTRENEKDEKGRVIRSTVTDSSSSKSIGTVTTYEYHANGTPKSMVTQTPEGAESTEEFDEDGFRTLQAQKSSAGSVEARYTWEKADNGFPTGFTLQVYRDGALASEQSVDTKTDAAGNIIQMTDRGTGLIAVRTNWAKVENPNQYASLFLPLKR